MVMFSLLLGAISKDSIIVSKNREAVKGIV
jgi:hypothetical protein